MMETRVTGRESPPIGEPALSEECQAAIAALERAIQAPPVQLSQEADMAQRMTVRLRDALIDRLRREGAAASAAQWRDALSRLNAALSLIASAEYPTSGIHRKKLEQARDTLKQVQL